MTFITGTVTNANPGPTLYALIETAALADGWTLDDTVTIGGNTHKVLKSAAAGNVHGLDWYLDINYPTTGITGGMRFAPFEGYTAASDVGLRGPFFTSSSTIDATTYSRFGASTSALETNWANTASVTALSMTLSTSTFTYWISITRNRIIVLTSLEATAVAYAGFFEPTTAHSTQAGAALFPLIMAKLSAATSSSSNSKAAVTRVPKATSINWVNSVIVQIASDSTIAYMGGQAGTAVSEFTGEVTLAPLPVNFGASSIGASTPTIGLAGFLRDIRAGYISGSGVRGDTVTVGSDTWTASSATTGNVAMFFKQA